MSEVNARSDDPYAPREAAGVARIALCILSAVFVAALASGAAAATVDGVTLPNTYRVDGQTLSLNGIGVRTVTIFHIRVYVAGLYLTRPDHDASQILASRTPKVLVLHFVHSGSKAQVEHQYWVGERQNCQDGSCPMSDKGAFEHLVAAAPAVEPGDTSTYVFANGGMKVYANDKLIGVYDSPTLARGLLASFIGKYPPTASLRDHLLGIASD